MARLHEYQGKAILAAHGLVVPRGAAASTPDQAADIARRLAGSVVVKIQAWTTGRAALGGVGFADTPDQTADLARRMLGMKVGNFPVTHVLVEERLPIARELFVSLTIDDRERAPVILVSLHGGSGIEERAREVERLVCDPVHGPDAARLRAFIGASDIAPAAREPVACAIERLFAAARAIEARSLEINPLAILTDGRVVAADCRLTVDDYAVFRHPELGIDIARELDHPPTELERIAYAVEQADHRGTFYFAQMNWVDRRSPSIEAVTAVPAASKGLIGFHGAGGGGSMMSMDAITAEGFTIANFCDTSGNPSPAKVYRAARIILSQPGLVGYFGSGSGVANQEQFWSAYGLAKAFWELDLSIPAVIRLGGNTEDRAVDILQSACKGLPAPVEGYKKNDPPAKIAARFAALVAEHRGAPWSPHAPRRPAFVGTRDALSFPIKHGTLWLDPAAWRAHGPAIAARSSGLLRDDAGRPALAVSAEELATKDSELIACEVECRRDGVEGLFVELPVAGVD
ncbi:MAG: ATP-grasp domain-containing protein [Phycisphaerales bacterium]